MVKGKIYGQKDNFRTQKVLVAAKLGNAEVQLAGDKAPAAKFPLGVTPAFEGDVLLFGAESIGLHLSGANTNQAETVQWLQWAEASLLPNVLGYVLPSVSACQLDKAILNSYKNELFAQLTIFNEYLVSHTFLVGERLSFADISVAFDLLPAYEHVFDDAVQQKFKNLTRWFKTVVNQAPVKSVIGEAKFASKPAEFCENKFKELSAKYSKTLPKGECKKKDEKKKEEPKKKEEKKPAAKPAVDDADEDDTPKEVSKDPFAEMPKGTFVLDNFKRVYSNEDTATKAIPYFWDNFDAEHNSIWKCEYKYASELTLSFMSCNLISGMFQRLEKLKKNGFASMILFGTDNNSTISGVWVWKGQELVFPLSPDWQVDYESYEWTKLDPKSDATKKMVNEYLLWEGDFDGKKFNQGKIFK